MFVALLILFVFVQMLGVNFFSFLFSFLFFVGGRCEIMCISCKTNVYSFAKYLPEKNQQCCIKESRIASLKMHLLNINKNN